MPALLLIAAAAAATPATVAKPGAFDAITAAYHTTTGRYCIRSGWGAATHQTGWTTRAGDCRTAAEWRTRRLAFDPVAPQAKPDRAVVVAQR